MISEAALGSCSTSSSSLLRAGGILTPTTALGDTFVERLKASNRFDFESKLFLEME